MAGFAQSLTWLAMTATRLPIKKLDKGRKTVNIRATGWELAQRLQNEPAEI